MALTERAKGYLVGGGIVLLVLLYVWLRSEPMYAQITRVTGNAQTISEQEIVSLDPSSDLSALRLGTGDRVITQAGAGVMLRFPDTTEITLGESTEFEIGTLSRARHIRNFLRLITGALEVFKDPASTSDLRIMTVTVTIGVRGTRFTVQHDAASQATLTRVLEGEVELTPQNRDLGAFVLKAGEQATVSPESVQRPRRISWVDWTSGSPGNPGTAAGEAVAASGASVAVSYDGEITFVQTDGGRNYWIPAEPYVGSEVSNAPADSDIIAINGGNATVNTVTFSPPVTDPVMAIVSLGQGGVPVEYRFDRPFRILSAGRGYWGGGPDSLTALPNNVLQGREAHGTIQFPGPVTAIRWTVPTPEHWHGFTIGIPAP